MTTTTTMPADHVERLRKLVGRNIRSARKQRLLTQHDLADMLDVDQADISRWERGLHVPRAGTLVRLAGALEVKVEELYREDTDE